MTPQPALAHPPATRWIRRGVVAAIAVVVGYYYFWAVRASGTKFEWGYDLVGYYDYLGRAFAGGHLYLPIEPSPQLLAAPNPWDPKLDPSIKWQDMVFYRGRYYLYFGAAPAVLLFTPFRLITHHDLPENFAVALLCFGGFLFSCGALLRVLDLAGVRAGPVLTAVMVLALGVCQSIPYLLNRVAVYEVAIAGGYFCLSAALFFLARATPLSLAASGLMFGLAMASRPHLLFAGLLAAIAVGIFAGFRSRACLAFAAALALAGGAQAIYNYERFGDPTEFGFRYQLAGPGQNRVELAPRNLLPGAYYMLLSRPQFSPVFPWMRMVFRYPFDSAERHPLPPEYFVEPTVGALWTAPFLIAMLIAFFAPRPVRLVLWTASAGSLAVLCFLMSTHLSTHRYEVDFLSLGIFAAVATLGICAAGSRWGSLAFGLVICYSAAANLAVGIAGPYNDILKNKPLRYVRIARWFSPDPRYRPAIDPPIHMEMAASFIPEPPGFREPLLTIGQAHHQYFLYVEHAAGGLRLISQSETSTASYDMPAPGGAPVPIGLTYAAPTMTISIGPQKVISQPIDTLVTAPAQIVAGENRSDPGLTYPRFTGRLADVRIRP